MLSKPLIRKKKTADLSKAPEKGNAKGVSLENINQTKASDQQLTSTPGTGSNKAPDPVVKSNSNGNATELSHDALSSVSAAVKLGLKKSESISLSLDAYDDAVEQEEAHKATLKSRLNLQNACAEWMAYAASVESKLMNMALTNADLEKFVDTYVDMSDPIRLGDFVRYVWQAVEVESISTSGLFPEYNF